MSHVKTLGKQGPQPAIGIEFCLSETSWGQAIDQSLVSKGKPAYLEDACFIMPEEMPWDM